MKDYGTSSSVNNSGLVDSDSALLVDSPGILDNAIQLSQSRTERIDIRDRKAAFTKDASETSAEAPSVVESPSSHGLDDTFASLEGKMDELAFLAEKMDSTYQFSDDDSSDDFKSREVVERMNFSTVFENGFPSQNPPKDDLHFSTNFDVLEPVPTTQLNKEQFNLFSKKAIIEEKEKEENNVSRRSRRSPCLNGRKTLNGDLSKSDDHITPRAPRSSRRVSNTDNLMPPTTPPSHSNGRKSHGERTLSKSDHQITPRTRNSRRINNTDNLMPPTTPSLMTGRKSHGEGALSKSDHHSTPRARARARNSRRNSNIDNSMPPTMPSLSTGRKLSSTASESDDSDSSASRKKLMGAVRRHAQSAHSKRQRSVNDNEGNLMPPRQQSSHGTRRQSESEHRHHTSNRVEDKEEEQQDEVAASTICSSHIRRSRSDRQRQMNSNQRSTRLSLSDHRARSNSRARRRTSSTERNKRTERQGSLNPAGEGSANNRRSLSRMQPENWTSPSEQHRISLEQNDSSNKGGSIRVQRRSIELSRQLDGCDNNVEKGEFQKTDSSLRLPRGGGLLQTGGTAEPVAVSGSREIGVSPRPTRPMLHRAGTPAGTRQADPRLNGLLAKHEWKVSKWPRRSGHLI
jgi:hypothetical protein